MRPALLLLAGMLALPLSAQQRSAKRGVCWDEKQQPVSAATMRQLAPGVSWLYNWGIAPVNTATTAVGPDSDVEFVPMCWNGGFNETALRSYLSAHPGVKYLLGFNEPNLSWNVGGCNMTPREAAQAWPRIEKIADDFGLKIVAPALQFSGDVVGGKVYGTPYDWLEEFVTLYPEARMDYLCLHCYMDYAGAVKWFATEYFYKDIYSADNAARYPHLVQYLRSHGELPMFLTEFCAFGNDLRGNGVTLTPEVQIDQMTQKLQYLELSDKVAGYAWFMANGNATQHPYYSLMQTNTPSSTLSEVGRVYVHMSSFDKTRYYAPGEPIQAKDYVDASTDGQQVRLRSNSEASTAQSLPLQVELPTSAWTTYQLDLPAEATYVLTLHVKSTADTPLWLYVDGRKRATPTLGSTGGTWTDRTVSLILPKGRHQLMLFNASQSSVWINRLQADLTDGIATATAHDATAKTVTYYGTDGTQRTADTHGVLIERITTADGQVKTRKVIR